MSTTDLIATLEERGYVENISDREALAQALEHPVTGYCGYDPTAPSLHVGNLLSIMMLAHLQRAGHRPIVIVGGGTGMIGDPSGKQTQRKMLTSEEIAFNMAGQKRQFERFIDFSEGRALMLDNGEWLLRLSYVEFLRDIGRHFSVNQLMQHETYRNRFEGEGLSFIEFNYPLLQAYDFLYLNRTYGCALQFGGSDQWFNILAGVDLVRRVEGRRAFGLVCPLITTSSGAKMGKTEAGAVWLDPERTSPYDYYQFWINTEDADVERFLKLYTFMPVDEAVRLGQLQGADLREAKQVLALEATRLLHGEEAAEQARAAANALFGGASGDQSAVPAVSVSAADLVAGIAAANLFVSAGLAKSRGEAKRLIDQGGAYVNGERVLKADQEFSDRDLKDGALLLRSGKKHYRRVVGE